MTDEQRENPNSEQEQEQEQESPRRRSLDSRARYQSTPAPERPSKEAVLAMSEEERREAGLPFVVDAFVEDVLTELHIHRQFDPATFTDDLIASIREWGEAVIRACSVASHARNMEAVVMSICIAQVLEDMLCASFKDQFTGEVVEVQAQLLRHASRHERRRSLQADFGRTLQKALGEALGKDFGVKVVGPIGFGDLTGIPIPLSPGSDTKN